MPRYYTPPQSFFRRPRRFLRNAVLFAALAGAFFAAGCTYKSEIRQGNDTLPEKIEKVDIGMSQAEVREILGANRAPSVFENNEWVYYYRRRSPGFFPRTETWGVRLIFDGDILAEIIPLSAPVAADE